MSTHRNLNLEAALQDAEARYAAANPESRARYDKACAVLPGGNTRSVLFYPPFPVIITRGEGASLWDADGHRYRDFLGEYTAGLYGHSNPVIRAAVETALAGGINLGGPNDHEAELAELISARFPSCEHLRFCNSGTEANLMAISAARAVTGRPEVMAFHGGYHGGVFYFGAGGGALNAPFPMVMAEYNDVDGTLALIERHSASLAAIIIEPMMGGGGGIPADRAFLQALREASTRHGIVLIFDEVMTSRLSPGGLQERLGIRPDLTSFGKYLGGGLTFGAFGGRRDIMGRFDPRRPDGFAHSGTYNNNVLTMAAGVAGLKEVFTPDAAVALNAAGDRLRERLNDLARRHEAPFQASGVGSILCLHHQRQPVRRPADAQHADPAAKALFHLEMLARGIYLARRGFVALSLPLEEADYDAFVDAVDGFLGEHRGLLEA